MYAVLEQNPASRSDCCIRSLSWKGGVPASEKEKTHVRKRCVSEGWLASGNAKGIIGATFTTSHYKKTNNSPTRTNFNLRGHNSEVVLVRWNEPFQKLATCDVDGIIFVWIKYEGRWSIELVNDRTCQVSDFAWSHDGRTALICYKDGFVLVGSVAGQRYWSSMLQLDGRLTCGTWTPDDKQVILGTNTGQVMIMDIHGAIVLQSMLCEDREIRTIMWSVEKFRMINVVEEDSEDKPERRRKKNNVAKRRSSKKHPAIMAVDIGGGDIQLMKSHDDVTPILIRTRMKDTVMEWSKCGLFLAVGGFFECHGASQVQFYNIYGRIRFSLDINSQNPLSALTWGHDDKRIFVACGPLLHVAWVEKQIAPLQVLCREAVASIVKEEKAVNNLTLPGRLKNFVSERYHNTVKGCIPDPSKLREFISQPPPNNERLHCTMVKTDEETSNSSPCYTLFLEYLGGLVPLLKGRRISKLCTEFVIYDPKAQNDVKISNEEQGSSNDNSSKSVTNSCFQPAEEPKQVQTNGNIDDNYDNLFIDNLPQHDKLVAVTSNIWGTKFKIHGLASFLPANMGQVNYKTSLLHLQPRQMSIALVQLTDQLQHNPDASLNLNSFSDDDDSDDANDKIDIKTLQTPLREVTVAPANNFEKRKKQADSKTQEEDYCDYENNRTSHSVNKVLLPKKVDKSMYIKQGAIPKGLGTSQQALKTPAFLDDGNELIENGAHAQFSNLGLEDSDGEERWAQTKNNLFDRHLAMVNGHTKVSNKQKHSSSRQDHMAKSNDLMPEETHFPAGDATGDDQVEIDITETERLISSGHTGSTVVKQKYPIPFRNQKAGDVNGVKVKAPLQETIDDSAKQVEPNVKVQQPASRNFDELVCESNAIVDNNVTKVSKKAKLIQEYSSSTAEVHVMHNKAPLWNENTQVYQLDFGGRVTQESAKNFQVEHNGKQVLQFGRIDGHAYTLDFQYPFSSIQAFAVALANITQRLK